QIRRQIVREPPGAFGEELGLVGTGFFPEFPPGGGERRLAIVDAALGHLPGARRADAFADEDPVVAIEQHHADAGAIAGLGAGHCGWRSTTAVIGARTRPFSSRVSDQRAMRSMVTG